MKDKLLYGEIIIYFIFVIIFLISPHFHLTYQTVTTLIFLNFDHFKNLCLDRFSVKYLMSFIIFIYMTFYQRLSILYENNTYFGMIIHKMSRKQYVKIMFIQNIKDYISLYLFTIIILMSILIAFYFNKQCIEYEIFLHLIIYLLKYYSLLFSITYIYQLRSTIKNNSYFLFLLYCLLIIFLIMDVTFHTHIITLSYSLNNELFWLLILNVIEILFISFIIFQFLNTKEINND